MHCRNATVAALALRASILSLVLFLPVVAAGQLYTFTHFAGPDGGPDWIDATGTNARFSNPHGVVQDSAGNLYVADASNHCIRKITPAGVVTTFAGMPGVGGSADGAGGSARFSNPEQLAIDPSGNIYVADRGNELIRRITPSGVVTRFAGTAGMAGTVNGSALSAQFDWPTGIAISPAGDIYVSDYRSHVIRKISGGVVSTFAGVPGESGATASPARFNHPRDLAVDSSGNVFVADTGNYTIRRITPAGSVSTFAGTPGMPGDDDGTGVAARFLQPDGVATDPSDNVWVAEGYHVIRKITPASVVTTFAGTNRGLEDGVGLAAAFFSPQGITFGTDGNLYVTERNGNVVRKITPAATVTTLAGKGAIGDLGDGAALDAWFNQPWGMAVDTAGNIFVADRYNFAVRKVTTGGTVSTIAGDGTSGAENGASGRFSSPRGMAVDASGNMYVTEYDHHTIRKVTSAGFVSTLTGATGIAGSTNGTLANARFNKPADLVVDSAGNIFVADEFNHVIRKITPAGNVTTFAGFAGLTGGTDGTTSTARFNRPSGIARDASNNLYVADRVNYTVRKITPGGVVTTLAGTAGSRGYTDGTGPAAQFLDVRDVTVDGSGNVFVLDDYRVRRITPAGVVTTVGGGENGKRDGTGSLAKFHNPNAIVAHGSTVYISSNDSHSITKGRPAIETEATIDLATGPAHVTRQLGAAPGATTYDWSIVRRPSDSTATLSSTSAANPTFTPDKVDAWVFRLTADTAGGQSITDVTFAAQCSPFTVGPASLPDGMAGDAYSVTFSASGGTGPYSFGLTNGYIPPDLTLTPAGVLSGTPAAGSYGFSLRVVDNAGCVVDRAVFFNIYPYPPPTGLVATSSNPSAVFLSWSPVPGGAAGYRVYRRSAGVWYTFIGETPDAWISDFGVEANKAYTYYVTARDGSLKESLPSNIDHATTVAFTDGSLSGATVEAEHIIQLRTTINAFYELFGAAPYPFTDVSLSGMRVKAVHLQQLREQLNTTRLYLDLGPIAFTDPAPAGIAIKAVHLNQIRNALR